MSSLLLFVAVTAAASFGVKAQDAEDLAKECDPNKYQRMGIALPASARECYSFERGDPVGAITLLRFEAKTEDLTDALMNSPNLPKLRALRPEGHGKATLVSSVNIHQAAWWTPREAQRFGEMRVFREYDDPPAEGKEPIPYTRLTRYDIGVSEAKDGYSVVYIEIAWHDPDQVPQKK